MTCLLVFHEQFSNSYVRDVGEFNFRNANQNENIKPTLFLYISMLSIITSDEEHLMKCKLNANPVL